LLPLCAHLLNMSRAALPTVGVIQGEDWDKIFLALSANPTYPDGDFSTWTATGQVRDKRADKGGVVLAEIIFSLAYVPDELKTYFYPKIISTATRSIPITKYQGIEGTIPSDSNCWIYDIEISNGTEVVKLAPGYMYIIGEANRSE
jgi:hypothetical protein